MAEFNVIAKLDPSGVSAGSAKVKQELAGVSSAAAATKTAINAAFDQQAFDKSIGALITKLDSVEKGLGSAADGSAALSNSNAALVASLDKVATSATKASTATSASGSAAAKAAVSQKDLDAAMRRVLQATDEEASELAKMNAVLSDAKKLFDAGAISADKYAQIQKQVSDAAANGTKSAGQQRQGVLQLGEQFRQFSTEVALGINPVMAFTQQSGQAAFALTNFGGKLGKVGDFLAGPWGTIGIVAISVLGGLAVEAIKAGDAVGEAAKKLEEDAKATEIARQAKLRFAETEAGVTAAVNDQFSALEHQTEKMKSAAEQALDNAKANLLNEISIRQVTESLLDQALAQEKATNAAAKAPTQGGDLAAIGAGVASNRVQQLEATRDKNNEAINIARSNLTVSQSNVDVETGSMSAAEKIKDKYEGSDGLFELARQRAVAEGKVGDQLERQIAALKKQEELEQKALQESKRKPKSDGVAVFRSQAQAIGIAGRELQAAGERVGENAQFGGVTPGVHTGAGHANGSAIDVNIGTGVTEANVPDLKARFDQQARRYQARGYTVLWNGQIYRANGQGPTGPIPGGQDQHKDHMHIEAPTSIVGKPTESSTAAQDERDDKAAEAQRDFVTGIVVNANARGAPNKAESIDSQVEKQQADFLKRFNTAMTPQDTDRVRQALTDAQARETAKNFDTAYVQPLLRLQGLQGKTGLDREALNKQLEETAKLGRALTPTEAMQIENSVKMGDSLTRQASIAEAAKKPLEEYRATVAALSADLANGSINQTQFNARMGELNSPARSVLSGLPGRDSKGQNFADKAAIAGVKSDRDSTLSAINDNEDAIKGIGVDPNDARLAAEKKYNTDLKKITDARKDLQLSSAQSTADSLLKITEDTIGKNNALYKGLFVVEKAVAIARSIVAIQTGLAQASANPFPENIAAIATVAAATASIVSNISSVALNLADGGYVSGPGSSTSDSIPANLSNGEMVINASGTARNRALLEAINSGSTVAQAKSSNDNSGGSGSGGTNVSIEQHPGVAIETQRNLTTGDVRIIAKQAVQQHAPDVIASDLARANSPTRKAVTTHTTARGRTS